MKSNPKTFLGLEPEYSFFAHAAVAILPFPYEGGVTYGKGAAQAPDTVLDASSQLELYDETLQAEIYKMGITTLASPDIPEDPGQVAQTMYRATRSLLEAGKFVVVIGGDHSISPGYFRALWETAGVRSVIQLDAHADLRDSYEGNSLSHACVMARIREQTKDTLHLGIRSISAEEADTVKKENISLVTMQELKYGKFDLDSALNALPDPVFLTVDVDVFDWSVISSTGTPEPGGFLWDEAIQLLEKTFAMKDIVGFDIVELAYRDGDRNSPYAVAKLIYKMLGFKLQSALKKKKQKWPHHPGGGFFEIYG
jgi:agmatinase